MYLGRDYRERQIIVTTVSGTIIKAFVHKEELNMSLLRF